MIASMGQSILQIEGRKCGLYRISEANICIIDFGKAGKELAMSFMQINDLDQQIHGYSIGNTVVFKDMTEKKMSVVSELLFKYGSC